MKKTEILEARATAYHLLSPGFLEPEAEFFQILKNGAFLEGLENAFLRLTPTGHLDSLPEASFPGSLESLEGEFRRLFGHTISRDFSPFETEYGNSHIFQQTRSLADITAFYRAFGLHVSTERRQRPDHISVELEFMNFLVVKEAHAIRNNPEAAKICKKAQRKFLDDHLLRWAPIFCSRLTAAHPDSFYGWMAKILKRFLALECEYPLP